MDGFVDKALSVLVIATAVLEATDDVAEAALAFHHDTVAVVERVIDSSTSPMLGSIQNRLLVLQSQFWLIM